MMSLQRTWPRISPWNAHTSCTARDRSAFDAGKSHARDSARASCTNKPYASSFQRHHKRIVDRHILPNYIQPRRNVIVFRTSLSYSGTFGSRDNRQVYLQYQYKYKHITWTRQYKSMLHTPESVFYKPTCIQEHLHATSTSLYFTSTLHAKDNTSMFIDSHCLFFMQEPERS